MIKLGIIGLNEGNGHPYSFSAIFNGYDAAALEECPFALIREYLPSEQRNEVFIENAKVTHIWTQDRKISELVARVSKIPDIVEDYTELIGKVDAVILARDDVRNHWAMAEPFLKKGIPIYIDKLLAHNLGDLNKFISIAGKGYPIMAGSSSRYTRDLEKARKELGDLKGVRAIHGVSRCTWLRYASHLLDGICHLFGTEVKTVQNVGIPGFDIVHLRYANGLSVVLQVIEDVSLPIQFTCFCNNREGHYTVPFTDYFYGFRQMLINFVKMVETGQQPVPFEEIIKISRIIIAGEISRETGNRLLFLDEFK